MRPLPLLVWGLALAAFAALPDPAHAAWNNVFQVCCNSCGTPAPTVAAYPADPCPQPCVTRYVQRTYSVPVTTYKQSCYSVPVTTYKTSYYYEACTSYRYSCCFNPNTCRYEQVAQPVTSYRLRSRCCPVTSYLQRTCMTPVTTMRTYSYYVPQTTCCTTTTGAPVATLPPGAVVNPPAGSTAAPPSATESREPAGALPPAPPGTTNEAGPASERRERTPQYTPPMPPADSTFRRAAPPVVRFDRITSRDKGVVEGRVVDSSRVPRGAVKVMFVSVDESRDRSASTTSADGVFRASLKAGGWLVYTYDASGRPVFSRRIDIPAEKSVNFTLVSR